MAITQDKTVQAFPWEAIAQLNNPTHPEEELETAKDSSTVWQWSSLPSMTCPLKTRSGWGIFLGGIGDFSGLFKLIESDCL